MRKYSTHTTTCCTSVRPHAICCKTAGPLLASQLKLLRTVTDFLGIAVQSVTVQLGGVSVAENNVLLSFVGINMFHTKNLQNAVFFLHIVGACVAAKQLTSSSTRGRERTKKKNWRLTL